MKFFKPKSKDKDTNKLILDYAEYRKDSDRNELFRRLSSLNLYSSVVSSNFELESGEKLTLGDGMNLALRCVNIQGVQLGVFFINKNDARLGDRFVMMSVAEAFDMVERTENIQGILLYNDKESYFGISSSDFSRIRSEYFPNELPTVTIPPGHKVVAVHPVQQAYFGALESGIYIVDFGHSCNIDELFAAIEKLCEASENPNIIWIIQKDFIDYLQSSEGVSNFLVRMARSIGSNPHAKNIVLPDRAIFEANFRVSLIQLGASIFSSADNGSCFVEVHKPDGSIAIGMPGEPFS